MASRTGSEHQQDVKAVFVGLLDKLMGFQVPSQPGIVEARGVNVFIFEIRDLIEGKAFLGHGPKWPISGKIANEWERGGGAALSGRFLKPDKDGNPDRTTQPKSEW